MEPFYYLHAELETEYHENRRTQQQQEQRPTTCLSVFGKDVSGGTVVVRIRRYRIQLFVSFRDAKLSRYCCVWLAQHDEERLAVSIKSVNGYKSMLIDKDHQTADADDYADTSLSNVVRLQVRTRKDVASVIERLDKKVYEYYATNGELGRYPSAAKYYESNLDPVIIATRHLGLDACRWSLLNTTLCRRNEDTFVGREYVFVDSGLNDPKNLFVQPASSLDSLLPPHVKILSFDIECLSSDAETMPDAARDPVIQISSVISADALGRVTGGERNEQVFHRHLFTIGGACGAIEGVETTVCRDEREMLTAFVDHVHTEDPDILTGYNVCNFDLPYVFQRIGVHRIEARIGRGRRVATCKKRDDHRQQSSRQYASFIPKTHDTYISGRVIFDMYTHMRKEVVLRSYTLNNVSAHFLGRKKDDVGYKEIPTLYHGDADSRARLGKYCVKDAQLVLELAFKTQTFVHAFERCKVFRTMLQYTIDRGQQIKFYSMLLAWCGKHGILVDDITSRARLETQRTAGARYEVDTYEESERRPKKSRKELTDEKEEESNGSSSSDSEKESKEHLTRVRKTKRAGYDGATVLDPVTGIYYTPVVCLDYASLYPSIMIGYNLCFTTYVKDERRGRELALRGMAEMSPIGCFFLTRAVKKGVLPSVLEMLLEKRADVRKRMGAMRDDHGSASIEYKLLDGQQSALKMAANSIYGAIGCDKSVLNFVQIPASVTAYGRQLILRTKEHVESDYTGTTVVYGDTDSVMVNLNNWDRSVRNIRECAVIGNEMAASVTRLIGRDPIRLQFETVYRPFLLCTKKRYAAGVYDDLGRTETGETTSRPPILKYKGLQVVRRDNCTFSTRLMSHTLESLMDDKRGDFSIEPVADRLREELSRLFDGRVNMKELVISKEWKKKGGGMQPHDRLAHRMRTRDPNSAPAVGDRVPYVVVATPKGAKLCDRAEDPLYVIEHGLQPDYLYYADNQVANPIAELLRVALRQERSSLENIKDMFWPIDAPRRETDRRLRPGEMRWMRKASIGNRRVTDYFGSSSRCQEHFPLTDRDVVRKREEGETMRKLTKELVDVEDLLDGLAAKCLSCKSGAVEAIRSCRDRECETLYERFGQMRLRCRTLNKIEAIGKQETATDSAGNDTSTSSSTSSQPRMYSVFFNT